MPYLQLRITLDPKAIPIPPAAEEPPRSYDAVLGLIKVFRLKWVPNEASSEYTCGFEKLNKFGEDCDPHFHFNCYFEQPDLKDPLRSAREFLKREAIARGFRLKGNKVWSCTLVEEPKDYRRWIRYPLKEGSPSSMNCSFSSLFLDELQKEAEIERKRGIELNILKREKLADKTSFRDKLFDHLDDSLITDASGSLPSHQTIWITILEFYQSQGKAICFKTVSGYTIGYQLHIKAITPTQCYVMRQNPQ